MLDDGDPFQVKPGDTIYVPTGVFHSTRNTGWEPMRLARPLQPGRSRRRCWKGSPTSSRWPPGPCPIGRGARPGRWASPSRTLSFLPASSARASEPKRSSPTRIASTRTKPTRTGRRSPQVRADRRSVARISSFSRPRTKTSRRSSCSRTSTDVPVVPWGGGSGSQGGAVLTEGGIALDLKGLDRIVEVDEELAHRDRRSGRERPAAGGRAERARPDAPSLSRVGRSRDGGRLRRRARLGRPLHALRKDRGPRRRAPGRDLRPER